MELHFNWIQNKLQKKSVLTTGAESQNNDNLNMMVAQTLEARQTTQRNNLNPPNS